MGSCPRVYSWDGHEWRLDSGTFGGAILRALQRTDVDNLDFATAQDGIVRLRVVDELPETDYIDALSLYVVDHAPGVTVAPDGAGKLHGIRTMIGPTQAYDFRGADVLSLVRAGDGQNWESPLRYRDTSQAADIRDGLVAVFRRPAGVTRAHLVLDGHVTAWAAYLMGAFVRAHGSATAAWYVAMDSAPERAREVGRRIASESFMQVAVFTKGGWQPRGLIWDAPPELVKRQVMELDLSGIDEDTIAIRLESAPSFWLIDHVTLSFDAEQPFAVTEVRAARAIAGGNQPVLSLLEREDQAEFVLRPGDAAELEFAVSPAPPGMSRTYVLRSSGWYRLHSPGTGEPDVATLAALASNHYALSRVATGRLNQALSTLTLRP